MTTKILPMLLTAGLALAVLGPTAGVRAETIDAYIDGMPTQINPIDHPAHTSYQNSRVVDTVGGTMSSGTNTARAKGNAYRIDTAVTLTLVEFWLDMVGSQTLTTYLFVSPVEFGTYTEVYRNSEVVTGVGAAWYASQPLSVALQAGSYYIIAVSWSGTLTYYYNTGDSQVTSFGAHVHGHATGSHPLPASIESLVNDQAIYHQRLTTNEWTPVDATTWGAIKQLYR